MRGIGKSFTRQGVGVWTKVHNGGWYNVNISGPKGECRTKVTYKVQGHRKNIFRGGGDQDS